MNKVKVYDSSQREDDRIWWLVQRSSTNYVLVRTIEDAKSYSLNSGMPIYGWFNRYTSLSPINRLAQAYYKLEVV